MFSKKRAHAVRAYADFIRDVLSENCRPEFHGEGSSDSRVYGDDIFVERVVGEGEEMAEKVSLDDVLSAVSSRYPLSLSEISRPGKERATSHARMMAAWLVQDIPSVSLTGLTARMARDVSSLRAAAARMQKRSALDRGVVREKEELLSQITKCKALCPTFSLAALSPAAAS
jgi:REP-associated tyrosine transposase